MVLIVKIICFAFLKKIWLKFELNSFYCWEKIWVSELKSFFDAENWSKKETRAIVWASSPSCCTRWNPPKLITSQGNCSSLTDSINQSPQKFQLKLPVRSFHLPLPHWAARGCIYLQAYWNYVILITLLKYHTWKAVWGFWAWCSDTALERVIYYLLFEPPNNSLLHRNPPEGTLTRNVWRPYGQAQRDKVLMVTDFLEKVKLELV